MVDAVDLVFGGNFQKVLVQFFRGVEVVAERLFDDHSPPMAVLFGHQADFRKLLDDGAEVIGRGGEIEETVAVGVMLFVDLDKGFFHLIVSCRVLEIAVKVGDAADKPLQ